VTLPPLRQVGLGAAIVSALEAEARACQCGAIYLLTTSAPDFFGRLGYAACPHADVPQTIRDSRQFAALPGASAMVKHIG
jgi:amino-acid N-acetyltransferase